MDVRQLSTQYILDVIRNVAILLIEHCGYYL